MCLMVRGGITNVLWARTIGAALTSIGTSVRAVATNVGTNVRAARTSISASVRGAITRIGPSIRAANARALPLTWWIFIFMADCRDDHNKRGDCELALEHIQL